MPTCADTPLCYAAYSYLPRKFSEQELSLIGYTYVHGKRVNWRRVYTLVGITVQIIRGTLLGMYSGCSMIDFPPMNGQIFSLAFNLKGTGP